MEVLGAVALSIYHQSTQDLVAEDLVLEDREVVILVMEVLGVVALTIYHQQTQDQEVEILIVEDLGVEVLGTVIQVIQALMGTLEMEDLAISRPTIPDCRKAIRKRTQHLRGIMRHTTTMHPKILNSRMPPHRCLSAKEHLLARQASQLRLDFRELQTVVS